jgi:O-antigen ligase
MAKLANKKQKEGFWSKSYNGLRGFMDLALCYYLVLMIVVLPFYNEAGYSHIGTDKAMFFRFWSRLFVCLVLPLGALLLAAYLGRRKEEGVLRETPQILWRGLRNNLSVTDMGAILFGISGIISYLMSDYKQEALMGTSGWYMGLYTHLVLVGSYFFISRLWVRRRWMVGLFVPVSFVVFLLGVLNRFGVYPIEMESTMPQFISTIGNINWYCAYLVTVFFAGAYFFWYGACKHKWQRVVLAVYVGIGFATLVTNGSSSGIMVLAVMMVVLFCLAVSRSDADAMLRFWLLSLLLSGVCLLLMGIRLLWPTRMTYIETTVELLTLSPLPLVMVLITGGFALVVWKTKSKGNYPMKLFRILRVILLTVCAIGTVGFVSMLVVNTLRPGSLGELSTLSVFTFSPEWGSKRGATWEAGVKLFGEQNFWHKLFGVGPDAFYAALDREGSSELVDMVTQVFDGSRLTNAHNEWLTVLVNEGILGFVGYVMMMVTGIFRFIKQSLVKGEGYDAGFIGACGLGILAYSVNSMVSFQQSMGAVTVFLLLSIGEAYRTVPRSKLTVDKNL